MPTLVSPGSAPPPAIPQHQPSNLFRFGEITLYSTHLLTGAIANTSNRLFATPLGQQGQGFPSALSLSETNLKEAGRIPSNQAYDVFGVACQVMGHDPGNNVTAVPFNQDGAAGSGAAGSGLVADLQNIVSNGVLAWDFTQTQITIAPVILCGAGGGVYGSVAQNAAGANSGAMNNGAGNIWVYSRHPVALPGNSTFAVLLHFGGYTASLGNAAAAVRVVLVGYYKSVIEIG